MDLDEILANSLIDDGENVVFEDKFRKVYKVLFDIPTTSAYYVKRVQVVKWKNKNTDKVDLDIRSYNKKENKYKRGITLDADEFKDLKKVIDRLPEDFLEKFEPKDL